MHNREKTSNKNILMVYPEIPKNTYWSFSYALPFVGKKSSMPPLGLITVAGMLPENYDIKLVDMNVEPLKDKDIQQADAVFTSTMIVQKGSLENVISKVAKVKKESKRSIPIVAGGPYPSQYYDKIPHVDHFIIGEAESGSLDAFIKDFKKGNAKKVYARLAFRKETGEREFDKREFKRMKDYFGANSDIRNIESRPDMSSSPIPRFDLLKMDEYSSMAVQNSRGCPHSCDFCNQSYLLGHKMRLKPAERFVKELEAIYNLGWRGAIFVVDDDYIGNKKQVKKDQVYIEQFQKEMGYPFGLFTEATIKLAEDKELMEGMRNAGFNMVFTGIESTDMQVLESMGKHHNTKLDLADSVKRIQEHGIEVTGGFIIGNDKDPEGIEEDIFDFCQKTGIVSAMAGLLTALPGAPLTEKLKYEGRFLGDPSGNNTHDLELNFVPQKAIDICNKKGIERCSPEYWSVVNEVKQEIKKNYKNLLSRAYDPKNYFKRCSALLDNLGYNPKGARDIGITEAKALVKSLVKQFHTPGYLKFIGHSLKEHRRLFPEAVRLAIMGYHHMKITKSALKADEVNESLVERYNHFMDYMKSKLSEQGESAYKNLAELRSRLSESGDIYGNVIDSLESRLSESGDRYKHLSESVRIKLSEQKEIIQKETRKFLAKTRKNIKKLPEEYRPKLEDMYNKIFALQLCYSLL